MGTDHLNGEQASQGTPCSPVSDKRPYAKPQLNRMGELRSLTQFSF